MWNDDPYLPLSDMLSPKKVHIPSDIVRAAITVIQAVNPRPIFDLTRSILPDGNIR